MNRYTISMAGPQHAKITVDMLCQGEVLAQLTHMTETSYITALPGTTVTFPPGGAIYTLTGSVKTNDGEVTFKEDFYGLDIAHITGDIHDKRKTIGERVVSLNNKLTKFSEATGGDFYNPLRLEESAWSREDIRSIEEKFACALQPTLKELLAKNTVHIEDSFFVGSAAEVKTVALTFSLFGYPPGVYSGMVDGPNGIVDCVELFARSIVFFMEVGDGMGMLAYDPVDSVWFWMHESYTLPYYLMDEAGVPWDAEDVLASVFHRLAFGEITEYLTLPAAALGRSLFYFDSSNPHGKMLLNFSADPTHPQLSLLDNDYLYFTKS